MIRVPTARALAVPPSRRTPGLAREPANPAAALALLLLFWPAGLAAQRPRAAVPDSTAIPVGQWDDDWWYPEGRLVLFGQRFSLMTGVTVTRFVRGTARDAFGAHRTYPDLDLYRPDNSAGFSPDIDFLWIGLTHSGRRAGYVAPTAGVRYAPVASTRDHWLVPFFSLRTGPYFAHTSTSGSATVLGANVAIGLDIARRVTVRARYDHVTGVRGHDLSTTGLDLLLRTPPITRREARPKMFDFVPPPGRLVDVGGFRLHLVCVGAGSPVVVLEAGMSDAWVAWDRILPELARTARVCAYDRAGIAYSEPGPLPRTAGRLAEELHTLLERAGERPPYVLVGHSFGGMIVRLFARLRPGDVAGMVLVDATHEDFVSRSPEATREQRVRALEAFRAAAERGAQGRRLPPVVPNLPRAVAARTAWYRSLYEEARSAEASAAEVGAGPRALEMPLVVVTAGKSETAGGSRRTAAEMRALWLELQADLVRLSPQGVHVIAARSGHYVQRSEPGVVIDAVRRVLERIGNPRPAPATGR
jgi:pimeloyl-ACP methyl ester carboxylesterase